MTPLAKTLSGLAGGWLASRAFGLLARLQNGVPGAKPKKLQTRRAFTRNATLGAVGIVLAEIAGGFVYLLWPKKTGAFGGKITVPAASVPKVNQTPPFRDIPGKFFIVHTEDGVEALYWKCVHLGCTVPWVEGEHHFHCPCHGSVYLYNGDRIAGPAPRALDRFPRTVDDKGNVTVDTNPNGVIHRHEYTPKDAVPYKFN